MKIGDTHSFMAEPGRMTPFLSIVVGLGAGALAFWLYRRSRAAKKKKKSLSGRPSLAEEIETALRLEAEEENSEAQAEFKAAAAWVSENGGSLSDGVLLQLYGCYKQALSGDCSGTSAPWGMEASMKWKAWKQLAGTSRMEAAREYVRALRSAVPDWSPDAGVDAVPTTKADVGMSGFGASVSTMGRIGADDERGNEVDTTPVGQLNELIHNGDIVEAMRVLEKAPHLASQADMDGMTPLHWAADSGNAEVAAVLLKLLAPPRLNAQDDNGETALHYAVNTEREDVAKLLIVAGADSSLANEDGETSLSLAEAAGEAWVAILQGK